MNGVWKEDGSFEAAKGEFKRIKGKEKAESKGKGKGKDGKGKKGDGKAKEKGYTNAADEAFNKHQAGETAVEPDPKKPRLDEPGAEENQEEDEFDYEGEWKDKQVCLINLKAAGMNGTYGTVIEYMGCETVLIDGKPKKIRRFKIALEAGKGEKSLKFENLFKVMTGSIVKLRGLDTTELNDTLAECGRLDASSMRYDVTLSDGRHIKVRPSNADFVASYETVKIAGDKEQLELMRGYNSLRDRLWMIEECNYPVPLVLSSSALEEYLKKFPKSVVIGRSNVANPKGAQMFAREATMATKVPPTARLVFVSMARDDKKNSCVAPALADLRHDELLRLGKLAGWMEKRCAPREVYFLLPGVCAKGPPTVLSSATCAWPFYVQLCTDMVVLESDKWKKSSWARLDTLLAVWAKKPLYVLPEKYSPPIELADPNAAKVADDDEDMENTAKTCPLSFKPEEPFTITRPMDGIATAPPHLAELTNRAAEAEAGMAKVGCPTLAVRRLG